MPLAAQNGLACIGAPSVTESTHSYSHLARGGDRAAAEASRHWAHQSPPPAKQRASRVFGNGVRLRTKAAAVVAPPAQVVRKRTAFLDGREQSSTDCALDPGASLPGRSENGRIVLGR